jgi:ribonuclease T1
VFLSRLPSPGHSLRKLALAIAVTGCLVNAASGRPPSDEPKLPQVALQSLPPEAQRTESLIRQGGPFPYDKDGSVFRNREKLLPIQARGYYREYTVKTPGSRDRGARRIVCGGSQPTQPEHCYYTADHYASFARIMQ